MPVEKSQTTLQLSDTADNCQKVKQKPTATPQHAHIVVDQDTMHALKLVQHVGRLVTSVTSATTLRHSAAVKEFPRHLRAHRNVAVPTTPPTADRNTDHLLAAVTALIKSPHLPNRILEKMRMNHSPLRLVITTAKCQSSCQLQHQQP